MKLPEQATRMGWQPLTPRGVGSFANASLGRLLLLQLICAVLSAAVITWFFAEAWFPTIRAAIGQLPPRGEIRNGQLLWAGDSPRLLAERKFLALVVDLDRTGRVRSPADVQASFGRHGVRFFSLFGYCDCAYPNPAGRIIVFNRAELEPWWGAWSPAILCGILLGATIGLLAAWALLATLYSEVVWLIAVFADRDLTWRGSWKIAGAAIIPGALVMDLAILGYGLEVLDLAGFTVAAAVHFVVGGLFAFISPWFVGAAGAGSRTRGNPFARRKDAS